MTQEEKQLLIKDLSARLPYGVKVNAADKYISTISSIIIGITTLILLKDISLVFGIDDVKPYLRPMSSMTEGEFDSLKEYSGLKYDQLDLASFPNNHKCLDFYLSEIPAYVVILVYDWLNSHHFDYRGLIERELAIEAPEDMYKT